MSTLIWLVVLCLLGKAAYQFYIFTYHPAEYAAEQQRKHELELAKQEVERAKHAARKQAAVGSLMTGVAGAATKAVLGAVFKHKHG